ncbi:DNA-binding transcriptional MerR regulator [Thermosporothrix hazakensis]|jgi:DNA-binding transcriptional MerR regulator|uniref:DNA-binding transcriptional MerR regulator n=1 Tax=Thermosporothrix hazakensis TaxID=644383 RepID=A0A326U3M4_THEHA|nr:MerR family transcriptional regulator [Thermosporothrix hazakensis]PZW26114.1 DNA-binding transcriptional MerR regulator [Thermosporothrix hazakensis]GCE51373.1 MerR family transcriptional regulator [Thermosporothrix hazakensis]
MYRIGQLAKEAQVSIRTLRYYDELGLLKPSIVTESGYRYYSAEDTVTLYIILALKQLGFSLLQIREMLTEHPKEERWKTSLHYQLQAVKEEKQRLQQLEDALQVALNAIEIKEKLQAEDLRLFLEAAQAGTQQRQQFRARHFTPTEQAILANLPELHTDDPKTQTWTRLLREVREHMHEPPDSPASQRLAEEIVAYADELFQGNEELTGKYWELIRPQPGQPARLYGLDAETMTYIDAIVDWYIAQTEHNENATNTERNETENC